MSTIGINSSGRIPPYQREYYSRIYESKIISRILDSDCLQSLMSFGNHKKLINACVEEIYPHQKALQTGATFGGQIAAVAERLGIYGEYDIVDISPTQTRRIRNKYRFLYPSINCIKKDALDKPARKYDIVICYMLLHEMPIPVKAKLINLLLSCMAPGGKVIFIDYHKPAWWNPIRWIIKPFNRLYQPFAENMWQTEIKDFVANGGQYEWKKSTYFGKMYQKLVVKRKETLY